MRCSRFAGTWAIRRISRVVRCFRSLPWFRRLSLFQRPNRRAAHVVTREISGSESDMKFRHNSFICENISRNMLKSAYFTNFLFSVFLPLAQIYLVFDQFAVGLDHVGDQREHQKLQAYQEEADG